MKKKLFVVSANVDFEVEAENENEAILLVEMGYGDISSFCGACAICYDDEEEE